MRPVLLAPAAAVASVAVALCAGMVAGCSPQSTSSPTTSATASGSATADACSPAQLATRTAGTLTVGTDKPAYDPWFADNDPTNGRGFESAVAYAVARQLGYPRSKVTWTTVPFNSSYAPGTKSFDFDVNQISITPARAKAVDFSTGYYTVNQAVITLTSSRYAHATSLAGLRGAKIGAQVGTTSLSAITDEIRPSQKPFVYNDTNDAKNALQNKQVDAVVVDLPTAFYLTSAEIPHSAIVGQFDSTSGRTEQFGLLFQKGSPLVSCVDRALAGLRSSGKLAAIQRRWLAEATGAPVLR